MTEDAAGRSEGRRVADVCVVGSGGREHALALALAKSGAEVVCCPGTPGMGAYPLSDRLRCSSLPPEAMAADLFVVGPEAPLVQGLADRLREGGCRVVGPGAQGARLEGSKLWMKQIASEAGVPTAAWAAFDSAEAALAHVRRQPPPYVVKADGLTGGKGVLVTASLADAEADIVAKLSGRAFGNAGRVVLIEEPLEGPELSVLALCDGSRAIPFPAARDAKRLGDGDQGPNTGGMGAFSPVPDAGEQVVDAVMDRCVEPTLSALANRGIDYRGVLYAGCILTADGPKLIEFNVRMGDPEAQVVLTRMGGDLVDLFGQAADGRLRSSARIEGQSAVCVVLASHGYPERPRRGDPVPSPEAVAGLAGVTVLQAGTGLDSEGALVTDGGRVLDVVGTGTDVAEARERAYAAVERLAWPGSVWRSDIAAGFQGSRGGPDSGEGRA